MTQRGDVLGADLRRRIRDFQRDVQRARRQAGQTATQTSRSLVPNTRPFAPPRPGRNAQRISQVIRWRPVGSGQDDAGVGLNVSELNKEAGHWIIQEIGTGQRATIKVGGRPNPTGRPTAGATYVRTVKSQRGRRISSGLVFATGPAGQYTPPGAASGQQLFARRQIKGVPAVRTKSQAGIRIQREIRGRHFAQKGGEAGFREYRQSVLAAARSQFRKT